MKNYICVLAVMVCILTFLSFGQRGGVDDSQMKSKRGAKDEGNSMCVLRSIPCQQKNSFAFFLGFSRENTLRGLLGEVV